MKTLIGIHHDQVRHRNGELQSFSQRWIHLAEQNGIATKLLHGRDAALLDEIPGCSAFMWRFAFSPYEIESARRIIQAVEHGVNIPVFPSMKTMWHFEDKISQYYILKLSGFPIPETHVFWDEDAAVNFCKSTVYPFVVKLKAGIQSQNVALIDSRQRALKIVEQLFHSGVNSTEELFNKGEVSVRKPVSALKCIIKNSLGTRRLLPVRLLLGRPFPEGLQSGYLYAQEYLPDNEFDTRITIIGNRGFAFRRYNRPEDFRASGSGLIDWNPEHIDTQSLKLAFKLAKHLGTQSLAVDILQKENRPVIAEISYTYASWAVRDCPGHWIPASDDYAGELVYKSGKMRPEDAIFEDFMTLLH